MSLTFNKFCHEYCDGLYDPRFPDEKQCTGYIQLKKMVVENITPASLKEIEQWENKPNIIELLLIPDIKYLRFLHPLLRSYIIENWDVIKNLKP
jgi:hypothetical protein